MRRPGSGLVVLAVALVLTACTSSRSSSETGSSFAPPSAGRPMYQMNAQHTGRSPYVAPLELRVLRTFNTSQVDVPDPAFGTSDIQSSAAVAADGTAYIGLHSGTLFALR
ncbi:MAG TPA: hypothetical protein VF937_03965, partial [Chloroflexota bacterium]